jgi:serine/threonine-protein kinase
MPGHLPEFFVLQSAVAGRYSLVAEIVRGGMGIVFAARAVALDRPVAIKLLPPALASSDEFRRRRRN